MTHPLETAKRRLNFSEPANKPPLTQAEIDEYVRSISAANERLATYDGKRDLVTLTVAIGRNVKNQDIDHIEAGYGFGPPRLDNDAWTMFNVATLSAVETYTTTIHSTSNGHGYYNGEREDTFVIVASAANGPNLLTLSVKLRALAARFGQESIAMTIGTTAFYGPTTAGS